MGEMRARELARKNRFQGVLFSGPCVSKLPRAGEEDTLKGAFRPAEHGRRPLAVESPRPLRPTWRHYEVGFEELTATRGFGRSGVIPPPESKPAACHEDGLRQTDGD
jgi:hypothetical protein